MIKQPLAFAVFGTVGLIMVSQPIAQAYSNDGFPANSPAATFVTPQWGSTEVVQSPHYVQSADTIQELVRIGHPPPAFDESILYVSTLKDRRW